ncbi:MAG TPA: Rrf2 family transcriptional regulator [Methylomirabilota bacterium]|nr:Rrf2 family transcriptional regulator [Methylomirabilota bacterium]
MLSSRTKYGIHALIYLAQRHGQGFVAIKDISEHERIPRKFLEVILLDLKGDGLLTSRPGPTGGYALRIPPQKLTLGHAVRVLEGPLALTPCVSQGKYEPCVDCRSEAECALRIQMKKVRDATASILDEVTFQTLADEEKQLRVNKLDHSFEI